QQGAMMKLSEDGGVIFSYGHNQQYQKSETENKEKKKKPVKPKKIED
ncbi:1783_t:CDS:1, partial [Scutellospora calospora]